MVPGYHYVFLTYNFTGMFILFRLSKLFMVYPLFFIYLIVYFISLYTYNPKSYQADMSNIFNNAKKDFSQINSKVNLTYSGLFRLYMFLSFFLFLFSPHNKILVYTCCQPCNYIWLIFILVRNASSALYKASMHLRKLTNLLIQTREKLIFPQDTCQTAVLTRKKTLTI